MTQRRVGVLTRFHLVVPALVITALLLVAESWTGGAEATSMVDNVMIDVDPSGNTATSIGTTEACASVGVGVPLVVDVVVGPNGIPPEHPAISAGVEITYNPHVLKITGIDIGFLLAASEGSSLFDASDSVPDSDGRLSVTMLEIGQNPDLTVPAESGPGVIVRLEITPLRAGFSRLVFNPTQVGFGDPPGEFIGADQYVGAVVAVDNSCSDSDGDVVPDLFDNCPAVPNFDQTNLDGDKLGDVCDPDLDNDGVPNEGDLCRTGDRDSPLDGQGCSDRDVDYDLDGFCDPGAPSKGPSHCQRADNCKFEWNREQNDRDRDGIGNVCDEDEDGDGTDNWVELTLKSDPVDAGSTPEGILLAAYFGYTSCSDGVDNDRDGLVDGDDPACPPKNDDFADAVAIESLPFKTVFDSAQATSEVYEPICAAFRSVWYKMTPVEDLRVVVATSPEANSPLAVWTGSSLDRLALLYCSGNGSTGEITLSAGVTVYVQVGKGFFLTVDSDSDADGFFAPNDTCPTLASSNLNDADLDGIGDICDPTPHHSVRIERASISSTSMDGHSGSIDWSVKIKNTGAFDDRLRVVTSGALSDFYCSIRSTSGETRAIVRSGHTVTLHFRSGLWCYYPLRPGSYPFTFTMRVYPDPGSSLAASASASGTFTIR